MAFVLLICAAVLEVGGDALCRAGLRGGRGSLLILGGVVLWLYGITVMPRDGTSEDCSASISQYSSWAVAQKSPCERNRVIMGKASALTLGQRGPDARQEVPRRTPQQLYAHERMMYPPDLLTCPHGGDLLVPCNSLAWDQTVPMLARVLSGASRPGRCPRATCVGSPLRLLSAEGQRLAPAGSTYGYDVVGHIGWWRQESRATSREMHAALASRVRLSESQVG
jgi:hypothetical protein